jgi:diaminopimelate epimerase
MKFLLDNKMINKNSVNVKTGAGVLNLEIDDKSIVTVNMGRPSFFSKDFPKNV